MREFLLTILASICYVSIVLAQPSNDECFTLIDLGVAPICPIIDTFNNVNATASTISNDPNLNIPTCFNGTAPDNDVWFSFVAPADGSITEFQLCLTGVDGPNGSIMQPQVAVYRGECGLDELDELACVSAPTGETELTIDLFGLTPGTTYFIRVEDWSATANPNWGDFELCIKEPIQIFNIGGTDTGSSSCEGTLFDSGGPTGAYQNNENNTFEICPSDPTGCITIDIVSTTIENNFDFLNFYEGQGTAGTPLWVFSGTGGPTTLQAGNSCVTVEFTSDGSITQDGFELNWSCSNIPCDTDLVPCQETVNIGGLPFIETGLTTCGSGNDLDSGPCNSSAPILDGEDFVYTYTPFNSGCIDLVLTGVSANTGLSVYDGCPESATLCLGEAFNVSGDTVVIRNLEVTAFQQIFIVISNAVCTDFDIEIMDVDCPPFQATLAFCEQAYLLNRCEALPTNFVVSQETSPIFSYFQPGINDGCWSDNGAAHYTWFIFQAQQDGDFGFLAQNANALENSNIDIQVWGPIAPDANVCNFVLNNQPVRSTGAAANPNAAGFDVTGLTNTNPVNNNTITDECESLTGDGFVTPLPVAMNMVYVVLVNDQSGNIVTGGIDYDFSLTSPGVLDGLSEGSFYNVPEYVLTGNAFYNTNLAPSCIQMTANVNTQLSCVWLPEQVDFSVPFTNTLVMNFGSNDGNGADGITLVYQASPDGTSACGNAGGGLGAEGIPNSLIIEFDTWQNTDFGDPFQDHIAVNINGNMASPISGPQVLPNIEDGVDHEVTFAWEPSTNTFQIFFDGQLQLTGTFDVINNSFGGSPLAFCGFTGSTGGAVNLQYVCTGDNEFPVSTQDSMDVVLCEGESLFVGGADQTTNGIYMDVFTAVDGCDSIVITDLSFVPSVSNSVAITLCEGESLFVGGANQTTNGVYTDTLVSATSCDSIVMTNLSFVPSTSSSVAVTLCEGESLFVGGANQTTNGIYTDTLVSATNCDSIVITDLSFLPEASSSVAVILCEGESLFVGGAEQTVSGMYSDTFTGANGCDSVVTVDLSFTIPEVMIATPEMVSCETPCINLDATGSTVGTYEWISSDGTTIQDGSTTLTPTVCGEGIYTLTVTETIANAICTASLEVIVEEDLTVDCGYEIPNAFTPDGDGVNDVFGIVAEGNNLEIVSLKIFNRWGQVVYEGSDEWDGTQDGKNATSDVYAYIFLIRNASNEEIIESGDVTLIR